MRCFQELHGAFSGLMVKAVIYSNWVEWPWIYRKLRFNFYRVVLHTSNADTILMYNSNALCMRLFFSLHDPLPLFENDCCSFSLRWSYDEQIMLIDLSCYGQSKVANCDFITQNNICCHPYYMVAMNDI